MGSAIFERLSFACENTLRCDLLLDGAIVFKAPHKSSRWPLSCVVVKSSNIFFHILNGTWLQLARTGTGCFGSCIQLMHFP